MSANAGGGGRLNVKTIVHLNVFFFKAHLNPKPSNNSFLQLLGSYFGGAAWCRLLSYFSHLYVLCIGEMNYWIKEWCLSEERSSGRMSGQGRSVGRACPVTRIGPYLWSYKFFESVFSGACLYKEQLWSSLTLLEDRCEITQETNLFSEYFKNLYVRFLCMLI